MEKPKNYKLNQGKMAEQAACELLKQAGLEIIEQNYHCKHGEIDIIARDQQACYVFVEVRFRKKIEHGTSIETVTPQKLHKMLQSIKHYLLKKQLYDKIMFRIDVIGFENDLSHPNWLKNVTI